MSEGIDCILLFFLCLSDIVEQTQLVEKELIRTLQSLVDVRLITMTEVRCQYFSSRYKPQSAQKSLARMRLVVSKEGNCVTSCRRCHINVLFRELA